MKPIFVLLLHSFHNRELNYIEFQFRFLFNTGNRNKNNKTHLMTLFAILSFGLMRKTKQKNQFGLNEKMLALNAGNYRERAGETHVKKKNCKMNQMLTQ